MGARQVAQGKQWGIIVGFACRGWVGGWLQLRCLAAGLGGVGKYGCEGGKVPLAFGRRVCGCLDGWYWCGGGGGGGKIVNFRFGLDVLDFCGAGKQKRFRAVVVRWFDEASLGPFRVRSFEKRKSSGFVPYVWDFLRTPESRSKQMPCKTW